MSVAEAVAESNRLWATSFNLDRMVAEYEETGSLDFDDLQVFVEIITVNPRTVTALGSRWDARRLMLFLVQLSD